LAAQPVRREILFEKGTGIAGRAGADFLPMARGAGVIIDGLAGRSPGNDVAAAVKRGQGRIEVGALPPGKLGKCRDSQTRRGPCEPPDRQRRQQ
jgi:hypothetical protein